MMEETLLAALLPALRIYSSSAGVPWITDILSHKGNINAAGLAVRPAIRGFILPVISFRGQIVPATAGLAALTVHILSTSAISNKKPSTTGLEGSLRKTK
jgi:hypothetical protein